MLALLFGQALGVVNEIAIICLAIDNYYRACGSLQVVLYANEIV